MANYKYENGNYYRLSTKGNWFKVNVDKNGYFTWTLPDGLQVRSLKKVPNPYSVDEYGNTYFHGEPISPEKKTIYGDPSENIFNDLMFLPAGKAVVKGVTTIAPKIINTGKNLLTGQITKKAIVKAAAKEVPKIGVSIGVGTAVDKASKSFTGKTWGENISEGLSKHWGFEVPSIIGDFTNPGYYGGYKYGNFITNNYSNLGRYTLNNLYPASYMFDKEHLTGLFNTFTKPLYEKAPTFYNHRPKWFMDRYNKGSKNKDVFLEARFENGANWAKIPESEVPRRHFVKNLDGTVSPTHINTESYNTALLSDKNDFAYIGDRVRNADHLTPGKVGGEHSDYFYLGDDVAGNSAFEYNDIQKLNPLWLISDWFKKRLSLKNTSKVYKFVDKLGGVDLSPVLGYRPFTIKAGYGITPEGKFIQIDPDYAKKILGTN